MLEMTSAKVPTPTCQVACRHSKVVDIDEPSKVEVAAGIPNPARRSQKLALRG
jgi:hypothetical protein